MAFTERDFQTLKASVQAQGQAGKSKHPGLRRFTDLTDWSNPSNVPTAIDANGMAIGQQAYLEKMPREQAHAVREIRDLLSKSQLGRQLLIIADQGQVQMGFSNAGRGKYEAAYLPGNRHVFFNGDAKLFQARSSREFVARAALFGAHELGHVLQDYASGTGIFSELDSSTRLSQHILGIRHMEAAAVACSIQVAWDVRQAGDDSLWKIALQTKGESTAALAFGRLAMNDPEAALDGRARRAAHDSWFRDLKRMAVYDQGCLDTNKAILEALAEQKRAWFPSNAVKEKAQNVGKFTLGTSAIIGYTSMPDGIEHMNLPDSLDVRDQRYTALPNQRIAAQMAVLMKIADKFRNNERVTKADFDYYDAVGAKFDGTKDAKPRRQQTTDNGHGMDAHKRRDWQSLKGTANALMSIGEAPPLPKAARAPVPAPALGKP